MAKMDKRVYGIIGISSLMANWNADFSGYPKSTSTGDVYGSDKALKYTMKKKWEEEGEKILYIKSYRINDKGGIAPRTLKERYEYLFNTELKAGKKEDPKESINVLKNLFSAIDVKNFGATFAEAGNNISITGAVQIGQGMNKYKETMAQDQQILSPFKDPKEEDAQNSTLGTKIVSDEAHYFYSFVINPLAYRNYEELGVVEGYTEEDYKKFKEAAINSATSFATNSKAGADNEFSLFIETDIDTYLPNLADYIEFTKGEDKNLIEFKSDGFLDKLAIRKVEIYFNHNTTNLKGFPKIASYYNILTGEEEKRD